MKEESSTLIPIPSDFVHAFALRGSCHVVVDAGYSGIQEVQTELMSELSGKSKQLDSP